MINEFKEVDFPPSKNNRQCLGPCYKKNTWFFHPIDYKYLYNKDIDACPVIPHIEDNKRYLIDECDDPIKIDKKFLDEVKKFYMTPITYFNCNYLLKICYNLYSIDDIYIWLDQDVPLMHKIRIINCMWRHYGDEINVINSIIVDIYILYIKTFVLKELYDSISKYISIDNDKIYLKSTDDNNSNQKDSLIKINYIAEKFINKSFVHKFVEYFIKKYKQKWLSVQSITLNFKYDYVDYVKNKIINSV